MKKITLILGTCLLALALLLSSPLNAAASLGGIPLQAQETPQPLTDDTPENRVTFADLGQSADLFLQGPLSTQTLRFSLPPNWRLTDGAALQIEMTVYLSNLIVAQEMPDLTGVIAGRMEVSFNGVPLDAQILQGSGERVLQFSIPVEALSPDAGGMHTLTILWDASASCDFNLATSIALHASSHLIFPHEVQSLAPILGEFPKPLYFEGNPFPADLALVLPDSASQSELQAALAVASALGSLTHGNAALQVVTAATLTQASYQQSHLILVGKQTSFNLLQNLSPAQPPAQGDGVLQMFTSPWNNERALLWVGGVSDEGVLKAAASLASGAILTAGDLTTAFVSQMPDAPVQVFDQDQTFADLGVDTLNFTNTGSSRAAIDFFIPSGTAIGADAYLDLVFNHSQLIDYLRSGIVARINGTPVGSVRLSDTTASLNSVRLIVPASALRTGVNTLEIQVDIIPRNICSDPRQGSLWVAIFPDSLLHLPVSLLPIVSQAKPSLAAFPLPFTARDLDQTTFVLAPGDAAGWAAAARLAYILGANSGGSRSAPAVLLADAASAPAFADTSLVAVGVIGQMPFLPSLSASLPAPLDAAGALSESAQTAIGFTITPGTSMGYLELAVSPASSDTAFLAVLGSDALGLDWAVNALLTPSIQRRLEGSNFALVQGATISAHTLVPEGQSAQPAIPGMTPMPQQTGTPAEGEPAPSLPPRPDAWALPVLGLSGLLVLLLLVLEVMNAVKKKK